MYNIPVRDSIMQKYLYVLILVSSSVFLTGCLQTVDQLGWGNFDAPNPTSQPIEPTPSAIAQDMEIGTVRKIGINSCDTYLEFMTCSTATLEKDTALRVIEEITREWYSLDTETLTSTCDQLVKEVQESPQQFANGLPCVINY